MSILSGLASQASGTISNLGVNVEAGEYLSVALSPSLTCPSGQPQPFTVVFTTPEGDRFINECIDGNHELHSKEDRTLCCEAGANASFSLGPPPPPPLSAADAIAAVKPLIHERTHHSTYGLKIHCKLTGHQTASCLAGWYTAEHLFPSTLAYAGTFNVNANHKPATVTFSGTHALWGCMMHHRQHPARSCGTKVSWH